MRPSSDAVFLGIAFVLAERGSCPRRKVGCVLVDQNRHILATGYNGAPKGAPHCLSNPCAGASLPSGTGLELCEAIHAEQNALIRCKEPNSVHTAYVTTFPCIHCFKMLANTSCARIVYCHGYGDHTSPVMELNAKLAYPMEFRHLATRHVHLPTEVGASSGS